MIGRVAKHFADALGHVFGYDRERLLPAMQVRHQQWDMGKSFGTLSDGSLDRDFDEFDGSRPGALLINSKLRQDG